MDVKYERFPTTVGIEYTFVPMITGKLDDMQTAAVMGRALLQACPYLPEKTRNALHYDHYAVEVPSPVFRHHDHLCEFSRKVFTAANYSYLTPRLVKIAKNGTETYFGTGGGHVHLGIPRDLGSQRDLFLRNMAVDSMNRFYLNWLFQEWVDDETLPHKAINHLRERGHPFDSEKITEFVSHWRNAPIAIRKRGRQFENRNRNTVEFRLFDAPRDTEMASKNVQFALSYMLHIKRLSQKGKVIPLKKREILERENMTADEVKCRIKRFFTKLDLDYTNDYHETYWPNYEMRAEYGKL